MIPISNEEDLSLLESVPDFTEWNKAQRWIEEGQAQIRRLTAKDIVESEIFFTEWKIIKQNELFSFGLYPSKLWRKFVLAAFLADLVSYDNPCDQVSFERLLFVMHAFPQGFKVWWTKLPNGSYWPVGYTGWYPMMESMFDLFENHPEKLKNRMVVPDTNLDSEKPFIYLFNFSAAQGVKKSALTKKLIKNFVEEINSKKAAGLACVTVSKDGVSIAEKFGMSRTGDIIIDGCSEGIYVKRFYI